MRSAERRLEGARVSLKLAGARWRKTATKLVAKETAAAIFAYTYDMAGGRTRQLRRRLRMHVRPFKLAATSAHNHCDALRCVAVVKLSRYVVVPGESIHDLVALPPVSSFCLLPPP